MQQTDPTATTSVQAFMDRVKRVFSRTFVIRLSVVSACVMFVVYALGTLVTTSGSGHGCGDSWPLCNGRFVPEFAISTAIEFTHRVATSLVSVLVVATAVGVFLYWRDRVELRILAPLSVVALFAEAGLGAALVLVPEETPWLLAIHFGTSLVLFTSTLFIATILTGLGGWDGLRDRPVPTGFRYVALALALYTYVVGYLGAYLRLTGNELGCHGWPTCNGEIFPGFSGPAGDAFTHRVAAFVLTVGTLVMFFWARRLRAARPDLYRGSLLALVFVILQAIVGGVVALTNIAQQAQLAHSGLVALLFGALAYTFLQCLPRPASARKHQQPAPAAELSTAAQA